MPLKLYFIPFWGEMNCFSADWSSFHPFRDISNISSGLSLSRNLEISSFLATFTFSTLYLAQSRVMICMGVRVSGRSANYSVSWILLREPLIRTVLISVSVIKLLLIRILFNRSDSTSNRFWFTNINGILKFLLFLNRSAALFHKHFHSHHWLKHSLRDRVESPVPIHQSSPAFFLSCFRISVGKLVVQGSPFVL